MIGLYLIAIWAMLAAIAFSDPICTGVMFIASTVVLIMAGITYALKKELKQ